MAYSKLCRSKPFCHSCGGRAANTGLTPDGRRVWTCAECGRVWTDYGGVGVPLERRIAERLLEQGVSPRIVIETTGASKSWVYGRFIKMGRQGRRKKASS